MMVNGVIGEGYVDDEFENRGYLKRCLMEVEFEDEMVKKEK